MYCSCKCGLGGDACSEKRLNICRDEIEASVIRSENTTCSVTKTMVKVNKEGKDVLSGRLESMRSNLSSNLSSVYTGLDMATGFPHSVIRSIVSSVDFIHSSKDIKANFLLFNKKLADEIMENINSVREQFGESDIETTSPNLTFNNKNSPKTNQDQCIAGNDTDQEEDSDLSCDECLDCEDAMSVWTNSKYKCKIMERHDCLMSWIKIAFCDLIIALCQLLIQLGHHTSSLCALDTPSCAFFALCCYSWQ